MKRLINILIILVSTIIPLSSYASIIFQKGNSNITINEVIDFQCHHCIKQAYVMHKLRLNYPNVTFKITPISMINKKSLIEAAGAYSIAKNTKGFEKYYNAIVFERDGFRDYIKATNYSKIKLEVIEKDMHSDWVRKELNIGRQLLNRYQSGTPLIIIKKDNTNKPIAVFKGETDYQTIAKVINSEEN